MNTNMLVSFNILKNFSSSSFYLLCTSLTKMASRQQRETCVRWQPQRMSCSFFYYTTSHVLILSVGRFQTSTQITKSAPSFSPRNIRYLIYIISTIDRPPSTTNVHTWTIREGSRHELKIQLYKPLMTIVETMVRLREWAHARRVIAMTERD